MLAYTVQQMITPWLIDCTCALLCFLHYSILFIYLSQHKVFINRSVTALGVRHLWSQQKTFCSPTSFCRYTTFLFTHNWSVSNRNDFFFREQDTKAKIWVSGVNEGVVCLPGHLGTYWGEGAFLAWKLLTYRNQCIGQLWELILNPHI